MGYVNIEEAKLGRYAIFHVLGSFEDTCMTQKITLCHWELDSHTVKNGKF